ncbi:DUF938 domain-containing protein [Sphingomonas sp.]|uniref:DUF938 domain-containing protein n=1 Tax=Sphingomonas sp. TaxID=28214 RepID=UPI00286BDE56|nr:DUF938 domain-containing protein [Sphingomonas sp.]
MSDRRLYEAEISAARRSAPAALRNVEPIGDALTEWLPATGVVLEVASGTGEHALAFARRFPALTWQPSDTAPEALTSIAGWREEGPTNLLAPLHIDAAAPSWDVERVDALLSINMVHISPWASALGLLDGAARLLPVGGPLILYGPWIEKGVATAPSNLAFDEDLRARDAQWGLRKVEEFAGKAAARGLILSERRAMPVNNIMLRLVRR